jgi:hypothetical protein
MFLSISVFMWYPIFLSIYKFKIYSLHVGIISLDPSESIPYLEEEEEEEELD